MATDLLAEKTAAAEAALGFIESGMRLGLGSGSTAEVFVQQLAKRVGQGLRVAGAVPTSKKTEQLARGLGLPVATLDAFDTLDVCIDGADEVDPALNLIKGGGGAHLREKVVAAASLKRIIMVDSSKSVDRLGAFRVPVEVIPFAAAYVHRAIRELGGQPVVRQKDGTTFVTDENNPIFDCNFGLIDTPAALAVALSQIPGVVEHGLFCGMTEVVIVGQGGQVDVRTASPGA